MEADNSQLPLSPKTKVKNKESLPDYLEKKRATVVISQFFMGKGKKGKKRKQKTNPNTRQNERGPLMSPSRRN
jgi:hypothetical protein